MSTVNPMQFQHNTMAGNSCIQYTPATWENTANNAQCSDCNGSIMHSMFAPSMMAQNGGAADCDDDDDIIVDLNSGSLEPVSMKGWNLMADLTEKFTRL